VRQRKNKRICNDAVRIIGAKGVHGNRGVLTVPCTEKHAMYGNRSTCFRYLEIIDVTALSRHYKKEDIVFPLHFKMNLTNNLFLVTGKRPPPLALSPSRDVVSSRSMVSPLSLSSPNPFA